MTKHKWKAYIFWIVLTEAIGFLSGWLTRGGTEIYSTEIIQPPLSPPSTVFPVVWAILFALLGISAARVHIASSSGVRTRSLWIFSIQLAFNFCWSLIFFNLQNFGFAFIWLLILWVIIIMMIRTFRQVDRAAARLQIPYFIWVTFAAYLNCGVWLLNR